MYVSLCTLSTHRTITIKCYNNAKIFQPFSTTFLKKKRYNLQNQRHIKKEYASIYGILQVFMPPILAHNQWHHSSLIKGQEEFDRIRPLSYRDANYFLICFAVNSKDSFDHITEKWVVCNCMYIVCTQCKYAHNRTHSNCLYTARDQTSCSKQRIFVARTERGFRVRD